MRHLKIIMHFLIFIVAICSITEKPIYAYTPSDIPKNVIMIIGDGMGINHITAAKIIKGTLNLDEFPIVGLLTTFASDSLINSSPGGTTALAAGTKTKKEFIGMDPEGRPVKTILEYAKDAGKGTGMVVTANVTDSTPACFVAHMTSRLNQPKIAEYIIEKKVDVIMGGGLGFFLPHYEKLSFRRDTKNLLEQLSQTHMIIQSPLEFQKMDIPRRAAVLLNRGNPPPASLRSISLSEMTQKAIDILSTYENGFFLMIEGSQIDWASHRGDGEQIIDEMIDLDNAIGEVIKFAKMNQQTLVVVVSDHETGGYTILDGSTDEKKVTKAVFFTHGHTAAMVPVFAYGPGSEIFSGIHEQAFIGQVIIDYLKK